MKVNKLEDQCPFCNASISNQLNPMIVGHFGLMTCSRCQNQIMVEDILQGPVYAWVPTKQNLKEFSKPAQKEKKDNRILLKD
jgi:hypothetical protein